MDIVSVAPSNKPDHRLAGALVLAALGWAVLIPAKREYGQCNTGAAPNANIGPGHVGHG
jgi:hypothetical protein